MSKNNAIWFFVGARYGREILALTGIAIALFAVFGTLLIIWVSLAPK